LKNLKDESRLKGLVDKNVWVFNERYQSLQHSPYPNQDFNIFAFDRRNNTLKLNIFGKEIDKILGDF